MLFLDKNVTCILFRSENKRNFFFLFQVLPNTWYKYIFPTTSSSYTRTDLRIFEQTKVWKCDQISQLLLCRSYIEKVWNIVTHEGNTKLPFALEHIRTTTFGAWRKYLRRTMFWKREYRLLFILNKKMHCKDKVYLWSL